MDPLPPAPRPLTEADAGPPRPGWAQALGVAHVVAATLSSLTLLTSVTWLAVGLVSSRPAGGGPSMLMGMDHPRYLWFLATDVATGLACNGLTFAAGVALFNLRPWGARTWEWLAPAKIARLVLVWGGFVVLVAPPLAASVGTTMVEMMKQPSFKAARGVPTAAQISLVYAWMFMALGVGMIVLGSIYPAVTWWLVRRRGIRAALGVEVR